MKVLLAIAVFFTIVLVKTNALFSHETSDVLRTSKNLAAELASYDDDTLAKTMANALFSSLMEDTEDGEDGILATMMKSNKEEAAAQFGLVTHLVGRVVKGFLRRSRYCRGK